MVEGSEWGYFVVGFSGNYQGKKLLMIARDERGMSPHGNPSLKLVA